MMRRNKIYTAEARRSGGWWAISVPELKGVHSQARRLDQVEAMVREAVALFLDTDPRTISVEVKPQTPTEVARALDARKAARQAEASAERATAAAVRALIAKGYPVRDAGALLQLSPARVSQIARQSTVPRVLKGSARRAAA
ncbi:MAG TPA: type II toxin-antitoxin system HicB family antitoxin [Micromonosporaceae bacterium]|nr:type II toxin-antitoxin system HicB family antitoxin [Micromonosporaceae bacterium]